VKKLILLTIFLGFFHPAFAQRFEVHKFGLDEGLTIELTKTICQDNLGFIWVGTDAGLSRFDGYSFTPYTSTPGIAFAKQLIKRRNGNLLLASDLGLFEITPMMDTARIKTLLQGSREMAPGKVWFPKNVYETADSTIFIAEQGTIVRLKNGNFKRFLLPRAEYSFNFLRAHYFFELESGDLILVTHNGGVYQYDRQKDQFYRFAVIKDLQNITAIVYLGKNKFLAGNNTGITSIDLKIARNGNPAVTAVKSIISGKSISSFQTSENVVYAATWDDGIFSFKPGESSPKIIVHDEPGKIKFNAIYFGRNSELWLSSESGIILLTKKLFEPVLPGVIKHYIQDIVTLKDDKTYVSDGNSLYLVAPRPEGFSYELVLKSPGNVILTIARFKNGVMASLSNGQLIHISDAGVTTEIAPGIRGKFIKYIGYGHNDDLWMIEEGAKEILNLKPDGTIEKYDVGFSGIASFSTIYMSDNGDLYVAGTSRGLELLKFTSKSGKFTTITPQSPLLDGKELTVNDIDFSKTGMPILATNKGVFEISDTKATLLEASLQFVNARSISTDNNTGDIWIGTQNGLFGYDGQGVSQFDVISGLPSKTIGTRTITIDPRGVLWVGTAEGVVIMRKNFVSEVAAPPLLILKNHKLNSTVVQQAYQIEIPEDNNWLLEVFSFYFPVKSTLIMYRLDQDSVWQNLNGGNTLSLSDLPVGTRSIEIRVKPSAHSQWSNVSRVDFSIVPPWYKKWWALLSYVLLAFFVVYTSSMLYAEKLRKENLRLEAIVTDRTVELKKRNEELLRSQELVEEKNLVLENLLTELRELNATKDKMFSIISHDLKNPFSTIMGFSRLLVEDLENMQVDEINDFINRIDHTARSTYDLLENLLAWSRSQSGRLAVKPGLLHLTGAVERNKSLLRDLAFGKSIEIVTDVPDDCFVMADDYALDLILRNLITNAIKFSFRGSKVEVTVDATERTVAVNVTDHGTGMNEETISKLFRNDVFHSSQGTDHEKGTGLGLILVKELVEKQGGELSVISEPAVGSTFTFTLPVAAII